MNNYLKDLQFIHSLGSVCLLAYFCFLNQGSTDELQKLCELPENVYKNLCIFFLGRSHKLLKEFQYTPLSKKGVNNIPLYSLKFVLPWTKTDHESLVSTALFCLKLRMAFTKR